MSTHSPLRNTFLTMRHGQSEANVAELVVSDPKNGCSAYGLTSLGRQQASAAGHAIADWLRDQRCNGPVEIYCSDFKRTRETADEVAQVINCKVTTTELIRERNFGSFELQPAHGSYDEVWLRDQDSADHTYRDTESVRSVLTRAVELVEQLDNLYPSSEEARVFILVSHGDTSQILQTHFLPGVDMRHHRSLPHLDPGGWRVLHVAERTGN